jgi:hypothetical protein
MGKLLMQLLIGIIDAWGVKRKNTVKIQIDKAQKQTNKQTSLKI